MKGLVIPAAHMRSTQQVCAFQLPCVRHPLTSAQVCSCKALRRWQQPRSKSTCCSAQLVRAPCASAPAAQAACKQHPPEGQQNDGKPPERRQLDHLPQLVVGCQHLTRCAILRLLAALLCACTGTVQPVWLLRFAGCCVSCSLCSGSGACSIGAGLLKRFRALTKAQTWINSQSNIIYVWPLKGSAACFLQALGKLCAMNSGACMAQACAELNSRLVTCGLKVVFLLEQPDQEGGHGKEPAPEPAGAAR